MRAYLEPALGTLKLHELGRQTVQALVDRLRADGLKASTVHNKLDPLRVLYRRLVHDGVVVIDPTDGLRLPAVRGRRERVASPTAAQALIEAVPEQDRALWATALYAGLRRGSCGRCAGCTSTSTAGSSGFSAAGMT